MDVRLTWSDRDEAGNYVVPYVLSPRDLVSSGDLSNASARRAPVLLVPTFIRKV